MKLQDKKNAIAIEIMKSLATNYEHLRSSRNPGESTADIAADISVKWANALAERLANESK